MTVIADVFSEIPAPKKKVRLMSKKPCFRGLLDKQMGNESTLCNLDASTFKIFINHFEVSCIGESLFQ